jgi:hypothetical protein
LTHHGFPKDCHNFFNWFRHLRIIERITVFDLVAAYSQLASRRSYANQSAGQKRTASGRRCGIVISHLSRQLCQGIANTV